MKVTVIIPTLNEEPTIGKVVRDFKGKKSVNRVIVYDGNSTDRTQELARKAGAKVIPQESRGKGNALREVFRKIDTDIYLIVDGDGTYPAESMEDLIKPIKSNQADMVIGTRLGELSEKGSLSNLHRIGNRIISKTLSVGFGHRITDALSGYRAIRRSLVKGIRLNSTGFEIETELTIKSLIHNYRIVEVPIRYSRRHESSRSKLSSLGDGYLIFYTILSMLRDYRPLLFFMLLSLVLGASGLSLGFIVLDEWLRTGLITKLPTAILSALLLFLSVQFFSIGVILDSMNKKFMDNRVTEQI